MPRMPPDHGCNLFKAALEDAAAVNGLPQELVPTETDREGNEILNAEEPVEFFQLGGNVTARGGIYGSPEEGCFCAAVP